MGKAPATKTQNQILARGINSISSNKLSKMNGRYRFQGKKEEKKVEKAKMTIKRKWYPVDKVSKPLSSSKTARNCRKTAKLRSSIVPGSVLILLSGRFRGKRVVFLKQLSSGTLLVTGKYFSFPRKLTWNELGSIQ